MDLVGIELGGTKCICTLGTDRGDILASLRVPTRRNSDETLHEISTGLHELIRQQKQTASSFDPVGLGIGSFGPLDLNPSSAGFGSVTATPKPGWSHKNILQPLSTQLHLPATITTDVNAAALAEGRWGAAQGLDHFIYVTIGTGIGAGIVSQGHLLNGLTHPEIGHMRIPVARNGQMSSAGFKGVCSFHDDCLEGLASGPAIEARTGLKGSEIQKDHVIWEDVTQALAYMCHNLTLMFAPQRILLGGGLIMGQPHLINSVQEKFLLSLNDYAQLPQLIGDITQYIQRAGLGDQAGPLGTLALAQQAAQHKRL